MASLDQHAAVSLPLDWQPLRREFLAQPPELVAPLLLGKVLARHTSNGWLAGRIVEVEAYLGPHITATPDAAAHSFRGPTARNQVLFGPPGHAYVYLIYGLHCCANVTCEPEGLAGCILLRALEPISGTAQMAANRRLPINAVQSKIANGPGKLCQAMQINRDRHNSADLLAGDSELKLLDDGYLSEEITTSPRIGISQATNLLLRFTLAGKACLSRL